MVQRTLGKPSDRPATCASQKAQSRRPVKARHGEIAKEAPDTIIRRFVSTCESLIRLSKHRRKAPEKMEVCQENNHNEACNKIRKVYGAKRCKTLVKSIEEGDVSLSDLVCDKDGQKGGVSLFEGLLTLPNGHLTIKEVLNTLMERIETEEINIRLGSGLLYRIGKDFCETKILEDLLKVRSQCKERGSTAEDAVNGVLTHPVMEAFIRQKWHMARFLYFGHIRC